MIENDNTMLAIGISTLKSYVSTEGTIQEKLTATMQKVDQIWYTRDEDHRFRCAVGAVLTEVGLDSPDGMRIQDELDFLRYMATGNGEEIAAWLDSHDMDGIIGIMKIWKDLQEE